MIKIAIIEDEAPARKKLISYLNNLNIEYTIVTEIETISETLVFLKTNTEIDLIFSDIELRDGNVFEVYSSLTITTPIIFTTAYDSFWMNAFETNGIEYLLKPYSFDRFKNAWNKFSNLKGNMQQNQLAVFKEFENYINQKKINSNNYKEFISVKSTSGIYFLKIANIKYIKADQGVLFAFDSKNKKHLLNQNSLISIQEVLNPDLFFKINRGELVNKHYVERINRYTKNSVAIKLKEQETVLKTSQTNTAAFNNWMGV